MTVQLSFSNRVAASLALLAMTTFGLAACGDDADASDEADTSDAADASDGTAAAAAGNFPVTVAAANGDVTIAEQPQRIVSLSATLTEMLFAVGAGDQVVAVDQYSDYPPEVPTTDLSGFSPNAEAVAGYDPDLVLVSGDPDGIVASLEGVGLTVLHLQSADSVDHALDQIGDVAAVAGHSEDGAQLVADLEDELDSLAAPAEGAEPLTYYYEVSDSYHSATSDTFIGSLFTMIGFESIADTVGDEAGRYPQLSAEFVLSAEPDLILLSGGSTPEEVAERPGWDQLPAVAQERVVLLDEDVASRWGPRMVELLAAVVDAVDAADLR